ncbi:SAP domain-containing ribonucleoprotein isoform X3 [Apteryx rowi]|nr:SAP domain-containing ribonucleoprotein isoform X3 [Apteryx rowi]
MQVLKTSCEVFYPRKSCPGKQSPEMTEQAVVFPQQQLWLWRDLAPRPQAQPRPQPCLELLVAPRLQREAFMEGFKRRVGYCVLGPIWNINPGMSSAASGSEPGTLFLKWFVTEKLRIPLVLPRRARSVSFLRLLVPDAFKDQRCRRGSSLVASVRDSPLGRELCRGGEEDVVSERSFLPGPRWDEAAARFSRRLMARTRQPRERGALRSGSGFACV